MHAVQAAVHHRSHAAAVNRFKKVREPIEIPLQESINTHSWGFFLLTYSHPRWASERTFIVKWYPHHPPPLLHANVQRATTQPIKPVPITIVDVIGDTDN